MKPAHPLDPYIKALRSFHQMMGESIRQLESAVSADDREDQEPRAPRKKAKRHISAEGRAKIAAAQRQRWAAKKAPTKKGGAGKTRAAAS